MVENSTETMNTTTDTHSQQCEMPFALVQGEPLTKLPHDLHIPPDALEVFLEAFTGPLDLLLYLIKHQNIDILDIPIAEITQQYVSFIDLMEDLHLELASEYLLMAAILAEIKSRMLLPRETDENEEEDDPRAELIRRLQEYERFRQAADSLDQLPRCERDIFTANVETPTTVKQKHLPDVALKELLRAFADVVNRADNYARHHITREPLSVRERMTVILDAIQKESFIRFTDMFDIQEGRAGVIVTLLSILELCKESLLELMQNQDDGNIYIRTCQ